MQIISDNKEMRQVYCDGLIELAKNDKNVVMLEADLMKANGTTPFLKAFPERTFDVGIAEANMMGVAAGLAAEGKIPFANTFTPFATRRCYDQVAISVAYTNLNVKICGTDAGITAEINGGTHMSLEDAGIMRNLPNMLIFEPTDQTQFEQALPQIYKHNGPCYMRISRKKTDKIFGDDYKFELGKASVVKDGSDVVIFAAGIMVRRSLEAAEILANEGINAAVVNIHTLKPIDSEAIIKYAKQCGAVVTAENHSILNGLGSAVCEVLSGSYPVPVKRVGALDRFGEVGKIAYLEKALKMTAEDIVNAANEAISLKR